MIPAPAGVPVLDDPVGAMPCLFPDSTVPGFPVLA